MNATTPRLQFLLLLGTLLVLVWGASLFEIERSHREQMRDTETEVVFKSQTFAENVRSTVKRVDEVLLDLREDWNGDWNRFAAIVKARQQHIGDIAFQVAIIDADGLLAFSNLAPAKDRTDLSDREHFRVHRNTTTDSLFISKPLKGKISGRWTIQFTRPVRINGVFRGVIVASVSPESFISFHGKLNLSRNAATSIARDSGEIMARYPRSDEFLGQTVTWPYSDPQAPIVGTFTRVAQLDGIERVFGYYKLPEYWMTIFVAEATEHAMAPYVHHRQTIVIYAGIVTIFLLTFGGVFYRMLTMRSVVQAKLRESEHQQRLLSIAVAQSNASVVMTDIDGAIVFVNDAFVRATGYSREDALGQNPRILKSGLNAPELYEELWQTITSGHPWQGELHNRRKNGELYWESATISPVTDETGRITHYIAVKEDITGRKQQEVELRHAKEDAESASIAKSQFLATMSHEIRTPMNGILGMAQMLLLPDLSDTDREDYARTILNSGNTLQTLLNDILDLSKVEAGKLELIHAVFDPMQMLEEIAALYAETARRKGIRIDAAWKGSVGQRYWADPIRLRQMLSNLVSNAMKFTDQGVITIEAHEVLRRENVIELEFTVADTGIGIPADKQALLFRPFSQLDSSGTRRYSGTGLGLSIVRNLAELMSGEVGLDSTEGKGSRFWFRVQVALVEPGTDTRQVAREAAQTPVRPDVVRSGYVMVVEDTPVNQLVIKAMLGKHGYRVVCHENGHQAVEAITGGERPSLVLMDCQMPVMDGYAATAAIRQWEADNGTPRLPIVALTASAFEADRQHCLEAGMDDFLTKPVEINRLLEVLGRWFAPENRA